MKKTLIKTAYIFTLTLFLTSCTTDSSHTPTSMSDENKNTITVMTYIILHGAGVDSAMERISAQQGYPGDRLASVLAAIGAAKPEGWEVVAGSFGGRWEVEEVRTTAKIEIKN